MPAKLHSGLLLLVFVVQTLAQPSIIFGQETGQQKNGQLEQIADRLKLIFQFRWKNGHLSLDLKQWKNTSDKIGPSGDLHKFMNRELMDSSLANLICHTFSNLVGYRPGMAGTTSEGNQYWLFYTEKSNLFITQREDFFSLEFSEEATPFRKFRYEGNFDTNFTLSMNGSKEFFLISQDEKSGIRIAFDDGEISHTINADELKSIVVEENNEIIERLNRMLSKFGVSLPPLPQQPRVKQFVLAEFRKQDGLDTTEFDEICDRLMADTFAVRQKATSELSERYVEFAGMIRDKLNEKGLSSETRQRLQTVMAKHDLPSGLFATVNALDLMNSPQYLVTLLVDNPESSPSVDADNQRVCARLSKLTDKHFGNNINAWREHIQNNR